MFEKRQILQNTAQVATVNEVSQEEQQRDCYEAHRHRVFALSFYMTGGEIEAEDVLTRTFVRSFQQTAKPTGEQVDKNLLTELKTDMPIGTLTLVPQPAASQVAGSADRAADRTADRVRDRNVKRTELEEALGDLPPTERLLFLLRDVEGYSVERISGMLEMPAKDINRGLLAARLKLRETLSA